MNFQTTLSGASVPSKNKRKASGSDGDGQGRRVKSRPDKHIPALQRLRNAKEAGAKIEAGYKKSESSLLASFEDQQSTSAMPDLEITGLSDDILEMIEEMKESQLSLDNVKGFPSEKAESINLVFQNLIRLKDHAKQTAVRTAESELRKEHAELLSKFEEQSRQLESTTSSLKKAQAGQRAKQTEINECEAREQAGVIDVMLLNREKAKLQKDLTQMAENYQTLEKERDEFCRKCKAEEEKTKDLVREKQDLEEGLTEARSHSMQLQAEKDKAERKARKLTREMHAYRENAERADADVARSKIEKAGAVQSLTKASEKIAQLKTKAEQMDKRFKEDIRHITALCDPRTMEVNNLEAALNTAIANNEELKSHLSQRTAPSHQDETYGNEDSDEDEGEDGDEVDDLSPREAPKALHPGEKDRSEDRALGGRRKRKADVLDHSQDTDRQNGRQNKRISFVDLGDESASGDTIDQDEDSFQVHDGRLLQTGYGSFVDLGDESASGDAIDQDEDSFQVHDTRSLQTGDSVDTHQHSGPPMLRYGDTWSIDDILLPGSRSDIVPSSIIDIVREQIRNWNAQRPRWRKAGLSNPICAHSVCGKRRSNWRDDNSNYACGDCKRNCRVCCLVKKGSVKVLPLMSEEAARFGPTDERFWRKEFKAH
ncbi:hypothetical protein ACLMJK_008153 [Lecanora helva]